MLVKMTILNKINENWDLIEQKKNKDNIKITQQK